jgi:hypothetical protein
MVLSLFLAGCAPVLRRPTTEPAGAPFREVVGSSHDRPAAATNPGKLVLVVVGVFSVLLVLLYIIAGNHLGGN